MIPTDSVQVRDSLIEALRLDLIGPHNDHAFAVELLKETPSRWYLTGFLIPDRTPEADRGDAQADDELDAVGAGTESGDEAEPSDRGVARRSYFPSSMGITLLVPAGIETLDIAVEWGDYAWEGDAKSEPTEQTPELSADKIEATPAPEARPRGFRRRPRQAHITLALQLGAVPPVALPDSDGLQIVASVRALQNHPRVPDGTLSVSVFLLNQRVPQGEKRYRAYVFQPRLTVECAAALIARPDLRFADAKGSTEWDERVADLHYRDVVEYATGHGVAAVALVTDAGCFAVQTEWLPSADVVRTVAPPMQRVMLNMQSLAELADGTAASAALMPMVDQYRSWLIAQKQKLQGLDANRLATCIDLEREAGAVARRIADGIAALADPVVLQAFRIANDAMAKSQRRRSAAEKGVLPEKVQAPEWRPFQLAFFLLSICGIEKPTHKERETVDLLFFPTGGGKTEAYLGIAAFTLVLRRLRHPGRSSGGVSVLMRYTLRLLNLDQLGRAATVICALELARQANPALLGEWPFEIGLWVGSAATPNRLGYQGYAGPGADETAYARLRKFRSGKNERAPIPLENCPWCGHKFDGDSFALVPFKKPENLRIQCADPQCDFTGDNPLPIVAVDEAIYRRLPAFLIATVDKFAALPWVGEVGALFGHVQRYDSKGFLGPMQRMPSGKDTHQLTGPLPPPDLIIQDELHLISGPLGTIAGVFETAIEGLCMRGDQVARERHGRDVKPKIIASTATVRRAEAQIRALFGRTAVAVFPPPGVERSDSFFARTVSATESPARRYLGVAAQGRSLKVVLLRTMLAVMSAAQASYQRHPKGSGPNPADPYMTLLGYFNSLRELGGSRRIVEDEVRARIEQYSQRKRLEPNDVIFANRSIQYDALELTSRVATNVVSETKRRLSVPHADKKDRVDVALATNMISVGLDITRLGLMVVLGQPKASAEYIQATSRVGRDPSKPGLVITLLNIHKPRDRSHFERFASYHASFYRAVEATSVTPFSPRALDRALAAALVGLVRHAESALTEPLGAMRITEYRERLRPYVEQFAERAYRHQQGDAGELARLRDHVRNRADQLLDAWVKVQTEHARTSTQLQYQAREDTGPPALLLDVLDSDLARTPDHRKFRAARSMRDVEPATELWVKTMPAYGEIS